jgi:prophage regulatory protein
MFFNNLAIVVTAHALRLLRANSHDVGAKSMRQTRKSTHTAELPRTGLLRLSQFVGRGKAIPISPSQWWEGVRRGIYPAPIKLGPKTTAWHASKIHHLIEHGLDEAALSVPGRRPHDLAKAVEVQPASLTPAPPVRKSAPADTSLIEIGEADRTACAMQAPK